MSKKLQLTLVCIIALLFMALIQGCGTVNGFASDTENAARFVRERTQNSVESMELVRIESALKTQNRIMERGYAMQ